MQNFKTLAAFFLVEKYGTQKERRREKNNAKYYATYVSACSPRAAHALCSDQLAEYDFVETLSFTEAMRHHFHLILIIQGAFIIQTIRSWPVKEGSREERKSTNKIILHKEYVFGNNKLKDVPRQTFRENTEAYLETAGDEVSIKMRSDTFLHFMKETKQGLTRRFSSMSNSNLYCKAESRRMQSEEWRV